MLGVYPFGSPYYGQAPGNQTPEPPGTHNELFVECKTLTCETPSDFAVYNLQDGSARTTPSIEVTCNSLECEGTTDVEIYNLQDAIFFNGTPITVIIQCPSDAICPTGYPYTVTFPPGTFVFPDPFPPPGTPCTSPVTMTMQGCLSAVSRTLDCDATTAEIQAAAAAIIQEIAEQQAQCDAPPVNPLPTFYNEAISKEVTCPDCTVFTSPGTLPSYITVDDATATVTLAAGLFGGATQNAANATATAFLTGWINQAILDGVLECVECLITTASPLPDGTVGVAYSQTIAASDVVGTPVWTIDSGALPAGLSLNSSTGEISGTPTTVESATFTVLMTSGEQCCEKEFDLDIIEVSECTVFQDTVWDTATFFGNGVGSVVGNALSCTASGSPIGAFSSGLTLHGSFLYTGPEIECNVEIIITVATTDNAPEVSFKIWQDGVMIANIFESTVGTTNHTVTIGSGTNSVIEITGGSAFTSADPGIAVFAGAGNPGIGLPEASISMSATFGD